MPRVIVSSETLAWGELDVPLFGCVRDWYGELVEPPAGWCLVEDPGHLWFIASRAKPAQLHPASRPGKFQAELWKHDVAELFMASPDRSRYLEINLSPNGAWWSCHFDGPRRRREPEDRPLEGVKTHADLGPDGRWVAAIAIPLEMLRREIGYGADTPMNVTFILDSPAQRFLTVAAAVAGDPDFHRPDAFPVVERIDVGLPG